METQDRDFKKYLYYLSHPWPIVWRNFLAGTANGIGFLFGSAVVIALLTTILQQVLGEIPFFSDFAQAVNLWLQSTLHARS